MANAARARKGLGSMGISRQRQNPPLRTRPAAIDETFEAIVLDWDGTAVPDRQSDAGRIRGRVEALCAAGVHVFIVSGTNVASVDGQLRARPNGPGRLFLCCNRGSEVFAVSGDGPAPIHRRVANRAEDLALDVAAAAVIVRLRELGLSAEVVSGRLNRRKIDLIPIAEWEDPKKADIALLAGAVAARLALSKITDLGQVVALAAAASRSAGLADPRVTSDVKHVEIGLTDKSDSARFAATWLAERGITGALVLVCGDEFGPIGGVPGSDSLMMVDELARATVVSVGVEPAGLPRGVVGLGGGPERFTSLLDSQLARRGAHRVPQVDPDPAWVLPLPAGRSGERVAAALGALGNGWAGSRASIEEDEERSSPLFLVAGVYDEEDHLLLGPNWTNLELERSEEEPAGQRLLDLRTGVLARVPGGRSGLRSVRFVSAARTHAIAMRAEAPHSRLRNGSALAPPSGSVEYRDQEGPDCSLANTASAGRAIAVAARDEVFDTGQRRVLERLGGWSAGPADATNLENAASRLVGLQSLGFDALLAEHREAWARRWAAAEVSIEGDPEAELAARFAVFHLLACARDIDEAAVGARGLTGDAYGGHVFWDADVFVLPALCAISPGAARAMLEYRIRRLPAARENARVSGHSGARFPWESASSGDEVTPTKVRGAHGEVIPILTGRHEEHIVADVAWAATRYARWTGDESFLEGAGRDLVVETARYWASRIRPDRGGHGHLYGVMGPDEYHEVVDDDAYTNVMARWNLRAGAALLEHSGATEEAAKWRALATALVDGFRPERSIYEQFAGYFGLEPLLVSEFTRPPVPIDVLLGRTRVAGSQLIKQADVLMLHHLVPEEVDPGSLGPCLAFYEPRTAHGSSLSPAISAALLARAGEPERAIELFDIAARLDLDDLTKTTGGGVHLATMGGLWQALAAGFLGLAAAGDVLRLDPRLPARWSALSMRFFFRGRSVEVRAEHDRVVLKCDAPLEVRVRSQQQRRIAPPGTSVAFSTSSSRRRPR